MTLGFSSYLIAQFNFDYYVSLLLWLLSFLTFTCIVISVADLKDKVQRISVLEKDFVGISSSGVLLDEIVFSIWGSWLLYMHDFFLSSIMQ